MTSWLMVLTFTIHRIGFAMTGQALAAHATSSSSSLSSRHETSHGNGWSLGTYREVFGKFLHEPLGRVVAEDINPGIGHDNSEGIK